MLYSEGVCKMNYSRKHIKKIAYNKLCGYHNRIVYVYSDRLFGQYAALWRITARHYSNSKSCIRW